MLHHSPIVTHCPSFSDAYHHSSIIVSGPIPPVTPCGGAPINVHCTTSIPPYIPKTATFPHIDSNENEPNGDKKAWTGRLKTMPLAELKSDMTFQPQVVKQHMQMCTNSLFNEWG